ATMSRMANNAKPVLIVDLLGRSALEACCPLLPIYVAPASIAACLTDAKEAEAPAQGITHSVAVCYG
ncbi:MAG: hypothetical protein KAY24_04815, partial [Candidatus Eisenbacteria sp.]|nr:hypothetical protein [Candidatus Eisenbacteria bacterium]